MDFVSAEIVVVMLVFTVVLVVGVVVELGEPDVLAAAVVRVGGVVAPFFISGALAWLLGASSHCNVDVVPVFRPPELSYVVKFSIIEPAVFSPTEMVWTPAPILVVFIAAGRIVEEEIFFVVNAGVESDERGEQRMLPVVTASSHALVANGVVVILVIFPLVIIAVVCPRDHMVLEHIIPIFDRSSRPNKQSQNCN